MRAKLVTLVVMVGCAPLRSGTDTAPAAARPTPLQAGGLDPMLEALWRETGVTPAPPVDDGAFLRRVSLDLIGRVPTLAEARAFLAESAPDRRARLVDRLLGSRDFAEHWGSVYADLLFGTERQAAKLEKQADPEAWLVEAFAQNRRWDELTRELITASGDLRDNGAVAFIAARARGGGGPEAVTGAATRIFLGMQIQCAQCHDHPYDRRWKQEDFYGLVAYFARTKPRTEKLAEPAMAMPMAPESGDAKPGKKVKPPRTTHLVDVRRGEARMRRPGSLEDELVRPRFLGRDPSEQPGETRRQTLARAILASDLFPKAMVARTWSQLFGAGLVDPWDDLGGENDPRHPPVLVALARDFAASGYDIKRLLRTIVLSSAYARGNGDGTAVARFAQAGLRPLPPEPLFRSLVAATGADEMAGRRLDPERRERRMFQAFKEFQFTFGDDEMAEADRFDGSVPQALLLLNGELTNNATRAEAGGVLAGILAASRDPATRLEEMFLAAYTRRPTDTEKTALLAYLQSQRNSRAAYEDLYFTLLTSTEAITNH